MGEEKQLQTLDIAEQEAIGRAVVMMVKNAPMILKRTQIRYEDMALNALGIFPQQGTVYLRRYISGAFDGQYSFFLRTRVKPTSDDRKISEEARLNTIAMWLEGKPVTYDGKTYQIADYPALTEGRMIRQISRASPAFMASMQDDGTVDYQVNLQLQYFRKGN